MDFAGVLLLGILVKVLLRRDDVIVVGWWIEAFGEDRVHNRNLVY